MKIENIEPKDIEAKSFELIEAELASDLDPVLKPIIKRCIHTTADFDYATSMAFSENVVEKALAAIKDGAHIITDTNMVKAGINKRALAQFGGEVHCFISDEDVAQEARERGVTRAIVSMERAAAMDKKLIFAIGNAPTALIQLHEMIEAGKIKPELVIGVPVGFVNVVTSKNLIMSTDVPYIVAKGRKGGSNVAAAICNALIYMLTRAQMVGQETER